jgi:acetyl-CoA acetyltransferase
MPRRGGGVAVVGVYETEQARRLPDRTAISLMIEAVQGALADAGLPKDAIDGVAGEWPGPGGNDAHRSSADWAKQLGVPLRWIDDVYPGGPIALERARAAIEVGVCSTVLVVGGQAAATPVPGGSVMDYTRMSTEFIEVWGSTTPVEFALIARRHMHLYGLSQEDIAHVSATIRNHGHVNPKAAMFGRGPYTVDDVLESRMVCTPFHLLDLSLVSEGAAAMIVTNRLNEISSVPVFVSGVASEFWGSSYVDPPVYEELIDIGTDSSHRALEQAVVDLGDVDVFQLYDPSSFEVIRQFEMLGYCGKGEGGDFCGDGRLLVDGSHPTNTDGGLLSHAHLRLQQMTQKVIEAVQQLRGTCGPRQVRGAEVALVTAGGPPARFFSTVVLTREQV